MKPLFESRYYNPPDSGTAPGFSSSFTNSQEVRRFVGERWLARNFELIEAVAHTGNGLVDLWEASPVRLDSDKPNTDQIIDLLFPGNPLLCCAWSRHRFDTRRTDELAQAARPRVHRAKSDDSYAGCNRRRETVCSRFEQHGTEAISNRRM